MAGAATPPAVDAAQPHDAVNSVDIAEGFVRSGCGEESGRTPGLALPARMPAATNPTPVAQLAEQRSPKPQVGGSSPSWRARFLEEAGMDAGPDFAIRQDRKMIPVREDD
jgi:hypothetical protein